MGAILGIIVFILLISVAIQVIGFLFELLARLLEFAAPFIGGVIIAALVGISALVISIFSESLAIIVGYIAAAILAFSILSFLIVALFTVLKAIVED